MKWKGHALVLLQVSGIALTILAYFKYGTLIGIPFLIISGPGLCIGVFTLLHNRPGNFSVHPTPLTHSALITTGPYRYVRHPMYVSVILVLLGLALGAGVMLGWVGFGMATLAVVGKTYLEEGYLTERYPEYRSYQQRVKRLIPFVW